MTDPEGVRRRLVEAHGRLGRLDEEIDRALSELAVALEGLAGLDGEATADRRRVLAEQLRTAPGLAAVAARDRDGLLAGVVGLVAEATAELDR